MSPACSLISLHQMAPASGYTRVVMAPMIFAAPTFIVRESISTSRAVNSRASHTLRHARRHSRSKGSCSGFRSIVMMPLTDTGFCTAQELRLRLRELLPLQGLGVLLPPGASLIPSGPWHTASPPVSSGDGSTPHTCAGARLGTGSRPRIVWHVPIYGSCQRTARVKARRWHAGN